MSLPQSSPPADPQQSVAHVVTADRRNRLTCPTLDSGSLAKLEAALRAPPWYRTRWTHAQFRAGALALLKTDIPAGVLIDATHGRLRTPPPFAEPFEPIELGENDPQLKTLSGSAKTSEEKLQTVGLWLLSLVGVGILVALVNGFMRPGSQRIGTLIIAGLMLSVLFVSAILVLVTHTRARWLLVPAGVAVVRRGGKRRPSVVVYSNDESIAVLRYISTGKTVTLVAELFSPVGSDARALTQREAISLMAAWQSPRVPPPLGAFSELAEQ